MTLIKNAKHLFTRFISFLLLLLSANDARAQKVPVEIVNLYGMQPTISDKISGFLNIITWLLSAASFIIIVLIGYRWIFKKGKIKNFAITLFLILIFVALVFFGKSIFIDFIENKIR